MFVVLIYKCPVQKQVIYRILEQLKEGGGGGVHGAPGAVQIGPSMCVVLISRSIYVQISPSYYCVVLEIKRQPVMEGCLCGVHGPPGHTPGFADRSIFVRGTNL